MNIDESPTVILTHIEFEKQLVRSRERLTMILDKLLDQIALAPHNSRLRSEVKRTEQELLIISYLYRRFLRSEWLNERNIRVILSEPLNIPLRALGAREQLLERVEMEFTAFNPPLVYIWTAPAPAESNPNSPWSKWSNP